MAGEALNVFISYSHRDEELKNELVNLHLKPLKREGKINTWQDRDIEAGAEWATEIKTNLEKADIVLLLITRHFLASDYCYEKEMQRAVQRHYEGTARVVPIILEICGWKYSHFKQLQVLPTDGKPVTDWDSTAKGFYNVEEGIRRVIDTLYAERRQAEVLKREQDATRLEQEQQQRERLAAAQRQREAAQGQRQQQKRLEQERLAAEQRQQEQAEAQRLEQARLEQERQQQEPQQQAAQQVTPTVPISPWALPLKPFEFEVVTLDNQGQAQTRRRQRAEYFSEDLGQGTWLDMVMIPGGSFSMGSSAGDASEKPQHQVTVQPFYMGKFAVTQAQWQAVAAMPLVQRELNPDPARFKGAMRPVERVSWADAVEFCQRLSRHSNRQYRLPSEAEWEYACRAGTTTPFHFGTAISRDFVNCKRNLGMALISILPDASGETSEVGSFKVANSFGLYDMHGNVWEWCQDIWHGNYDGAPTDGSAWVEGGASSLRLLRGGSWFNGPQFCRSANRINNYPDVRNDYFGFRIVSGSARAFS